MMARILLLTLAACMLASVSAKIDKFHVIKTEPVNKDEPIPTFDELRKEMLQDEQNVEVGGEEIKAEDEVILISPDQVVKLFLRNPGETVEEVFFRDFLPTNAILMDFHIRNRGIYGSISKDTYSEAEEHFLGSDGEEARSKAILGMVHSDSDHENIRWLDQKHVSDLNWENINREITGMLVEVVPHDVISIRIVFREVIPATPEAFKDLYKTHLTAHLSPRGNGLEGLFESPNYPFNYPDNADIKWLIRLPPNRNFGVNVQLNEMMTESCCDRLYLYDGPSIYSPVLGLLSGNFTNNTISNYTSTGPDLLVEFRSDCLINTGYFSLNFTSVHFPLVPACNGQEVVEGREGYITTSNYPIDYPEEAYCDWLIVTPRLTTVVLQIVDFNIDNRDHLRIYDIFLSGRSEIADLAGNQDANGMIYGHSNSMELIFDTADHIISRRGFVFYYTAQPVPQPCDQGVVIEQNQGEISSMNYPSVYDNDLDCSWQLRVDTGSVVYINIDDINTEEYFDYLRIYDGPDTNSKLIASLSGTEGLERAYITTQNIALLTFQSDYSVGDSGFHLTYEAYSTSTQCSDTPQIVNGQAGYVTTPGYPNPFPAFSNCQWIVQTDYNTILTLALVDVNLGLVDSNVLTVYDGVSTSSRVLFDHGHLPRAETLFLNATQNQVLITLNTGDNREDRGFLIRFDQYDLVTQCSATNSLIAPQGEFNSPLYPGNYPSGYTCSFLIETPLLTTVSLLKKEFELGVEDTLIAYDGDSDKDNILFECSNNICPIVPASRNHMFLVFTSKASKPGFSFNFYGSSDTCQGSHHYSDSATSGYITSPMFPTNYPNNLDCTWSLTGLPNNIIEIEISALQTEACCDWLRIYDGDSMASPMLLDFSGTHGDTTITTSGNNAFVSFDVDASVTYRGFTLQYKAYTPKDAYDGSASGDDEYLCSAYDFMGENSNSTQGYIVSPGYSTNYPNNLDYCWYLTFPSRFELIELTFARVNVEEFFDVIQVFKGETTFPSSQVAEITGIVEQFQVNVLGTSATILFHTDDSVTNKGFVMQYNAVL